ncbi:MAG: PKD domain-containing protein [Bacteroidales bacterium]|nr:PKD domain-containing protein [Bacteroidales bacterium]
MKKINIIFKILFICCLFGYHQGFAQYIRPIFPKDGQMIYADTVHFQWNQHLATSTYHLQIATDTAFTQLMVNADVQGSDTIIRGFLTDTTYYWRIMPQGGTYGPCLKFIYFTPCMIPNLVGWYAADSCHLTQSGTIDTLYDKSGNNNYLIQSTANRRPLWIEQDSTINDYPSIYFDGTTDQLYMDSTLMVSQPNTYCFICQSTTTATSAFALFSGNVASPRNHLSHTTQVYRMLATSTLDGINSYPQVFGYSRFYAYFNGNKSYAKKNDTIVVSGNVGTANMSGLRLAGTASGAYMKGYIPEFIYYHAILDSIQNRMLAQYISEKYHGRLNLGADIAAPSFCSMVLQPDREYVSYLWSTGDTTSSISVQQNGTYWLTTINRFGWQETDTIDVFLNTPPISDTIICYGDSVKWDMNYQYPYTYQWSNGQVGEQFTTDKEGEYHVILTDSLQRQIGLKFYVTTTNQTQTLTAITPIDSLCNGNSITLQYPQETANFHVVWSTGDSNSLQTVFTQTGWYVVQVQDSIGCIGRDSIYVIKKGNAPLVSFTADNICMRDSTTFVNTSTTDDGSTIVLSEWTLGDGQDFTPASALQGFKHLYDTAGMYRVSLHCVSSTGCEQEYAQTIAVYSLPQPEFSPVEACEHSEVAFDNQTQSEYRVKAYTWQIDQDSSADEHPKYVFQTAGTYTVALAAETVLGCKDTISKTIVVKENPEVKISVSNTCLHDAIYINDQTEVSPSQTIISRSWQVDKQEVAANNRIALTYDKEGRHEVKLAVQYINGCRNEHTDTITIYKKPVADFTIEDACLGQEINIVNRSVVYADSLAWYNWKSGNYHSTEASPNLTAKDTGHFTMYLYVTDRNGCSDTAEKDFMVSMQPSAGFVYAYDAESLFAIQFENQSEAEGCSYLWQFDQLGSSTEENPRFDFEEAGAYEVTLLAGNAIGCTDTSRQTIYIEEPAVDIEIVDYDLLPQGDYLRPRIQILSRSNRDIPYLNFEIDYNHYTVLQADSNSLQAGTFKSYLLSNLIKKSHLAKYSCVEITTPYDQYKTQTEPVSTCILLGEDYVVSEVFPNPVSNSVNFWIRTDITLDVALQVCDMYGRVLYQTETTKYTNGQYQFQIPADTWASGVYVLKIVCNNVVELRRIWKQ